jgi:hypothetical protein
MNKMQGCESFFVYFHRAFLERALKIYPPIFVVIDSLKAVLLSATKSHYKLIAFLLGN